MQVPPALPWELSGEYDTIYLCTLSLWNDSVVEGRLIVSLASRAYGYAPFGRTFPPFRTWGRSSQRASWAAPDGGSSQLHDTVLAR